MNEIWKDMPGYEGRYIISNEGRIMSLPTSWITGRGGILKYPGKIKCLPAPSLEDTPIPK